MRFPLAVIALSLLVGHPVPCTSGTVRSATPAIGSAPSVYHADTVTTQLTPELLQRYIAVQRALKDFLQAHPQKKSSTSTLRTTVTLTNADGSTTEEKIAVLDYVKLTEQDSALAALFVKNHLPTDQFVATHLAVYQALYTISSQQVADHPKPVDETSAAGRNIALVQPAVAKLADAGMSVVAQAKIGHRAPQLVVQHLVNTSKDNIKPTFGDGQVYVLDFTAHWCGPCLNMYPIMAELAKTYANRGVHIIYVTQLFGYYGTEKNITPSVELDSLTGYTVRHHFVGPVAVVPDISGAGFSVSGLPSLAVIDRKGNLRARFNLETMALDVVLPEAIDSALAVKVGP